MLKLINLLSDCLILYKSIQEKALGIATHITLCLGSNCFESHQHITSEKESVGNEVRMQ